jgi:hypothetical protein
MLQRCSWSILLTEFDRFSSWRYLLLTENIAGVNNALKCPFPYFGAKSRAAQLIWQRLGNVGNYI